jgi:hypothetical protein
MDFDLHIEIIKEALCEGFSYDYNSLIWPRIEIMANGMFIIEFEIYDSYYYWWNRKQNKIDLCDPNAQEIIKKVVLNNMEYHIGYPGNYYIESPTSELDYLKNLYIKLKKSQNESI